MKDLSRNSIKKNERKGKEKFGDFIKRYFLEILGVICILILLIILLLTGGKKSINYNTSNVKVRTKTVTRRNDSKSVKVNNYDKNTYELNKRSFNELFINQYESQGIFKIKPTDLLEGNTIIRFSDNVYAIHISGDKQVIDNVVFRFISNYKNLLEKMEKSDNSITLYIRRKENFAFDITLKDKEKLAKRFTKNDTLFYIEYQEGSAE